MYLTKSACSQQCTTLITWVLHWVFIVITAHLQNSLITCLTNTLNIKGNSLMFKVFNALKGLNGNFILQMSADSSLVLPKARSADKVFHYSGAPPAPHPGIGHKQIWFPFTPHIRSKAPTETWAEKSPFLVVRVWFLAQQNLLIQNENYFISRIWFPVSIS